jgi:hypothetical protein
MRRSLCSTSTFRHWRPPRHQLRRRRDQTSQGGLGRPFFLRPARNSGLPILPAFARRELLGRANIWPLEPPARHFRSGRHQLDRAGSDALDPELGRYSLWR